MDVDLVCANWDAVGFRWNVQSLTDDSENEEKVPRMHFARGSTATEFKKFEEIKTQRHGGHGGR